jgi:hypothetical protein
MHPVLLLTLCFRSIQSMSTRAPTIASITSGTSGSSIDFININIGNVLDFWSDHWAEASRNQRECGVHLWSIFIELVHHAALHNQVQCLPLVRAKR